jgi:uncharacterized damage-inducible protein DinB
MEAIKWFARKFVFNYTQENYPILLARMMDAPQALIDVVKHIPEEILLHRYDGKWSLKEHVGHLSVLEPLWQARIEDIRAGAEVLTPADLDNKATSAAEFNNYKIESLITRFLYERVKTINFLSEINILSISHKSLHPRMLQYLSIVDHLYFIAEHDKHHIDYLILKIKQLNNR